CQRPPAAGPGTVAASPEVAGEMVPSRGEGPDRARPVGVVVGNPKPASRTLSVAVTLADAVGASLGLPRPAEPVVDLAELGPRLFDWSDATVSGIVERVARCRLLVVASPTYKGSYTGLL